MFILTSFDKIDQYNNENFLQFAIHFPPKHLHEQIPVTPFIPGHNGLIIKSEDFMDKPKEYREELKKIYRAKKEKILQWLHELPKDKNVVLFCHCNVEKKENQIAKYGYMLCHSGVVGQIILKLFPAVKIELDEDRKQYLHLFLHPSYDPIKCAKCALGGIEKCGEWKNYCYGPYEIREDGGIYTIREKTKEEANVNRSNKIILRNSSAGNNRYLQGKKRNERRSNKVFQITGV